MVELLIFLALLGWGIVSTVEFLASLAAFPTLIAAAIAVPVLAALGYEHLLARHRLEFLRTKRKFLPPERFYWPTQARGLRRWMVGFVLLALIAWPAAIYFPAMLSANPESLLGWIAGLCAITGSGLAFSYGWLFFRGSQRFDRLTPAVIGALRRFMFRISDNPEFLDEEPETAKQVNKKSVY